MRLTASIIQDKDGDGKSAVQEISVSIPVPTRCMVLTTLGFQWARIDLCFMNRPNHHKGAGHCYAISRAKPQ